MLSYTGIDSERTAVRFHDRYAFLSHGGGRLCPQIPCLPWTGCQHHPAFCLLLPPPLTTSFCPHFVPAPPHFVGLSAHFCPLRIFVHFLRFTSPAQSYRSFGSTQLHRSRTPLVVCQITYHRILFLRVSGSVPDLRNCIASIGRNCGPKYSDFGANAGPSVELLIAPATGLRGVSLRTSYGAVSLVYVTGSRKPYHPSAMVSSSRTAPSLCHPVPGNERGLSVRPDADGSSARRSSRRSPLSPGGLHAQKREGCEDGRPLDVGLALGFAGWR